MVKLRSCPFCDSDKISPNEAMSVSRGKQYQQTGCITCGALGPRAERKEESANELWNMRTRRKQ